MILCHTGRSYVLLTQILDQYPQFYQTNTEWAVLNGSLGRRSEMLDGVTFEYAEMTLTLQRHSTTYEATTVIPALGEFVCALRDCRKSREPDVSLSRNVAFREKLF